MWVWSVFFFQAEDGIRDLVRSRGLGDVYKRQSLFQPVILEKIGRYRVLCRNNHQLGRECELCHLLLLCLLYTSDAADERSSVDLGGRRIIQKKTKKENICMVVIIYNQIMQER